AVEPQNVQVSPPQPDPGERVLRNRRGLNRPRADSPGKTTGGQNTGAEKQMFPHHADTLSSQLWCSFHFHARGEESFPAASFSFARHSRKQAWNRRAVEGTRRGTHPAHPLRP